MRRPTFQIWQFRNRKRIKKKKSRLIKIMARSRAIKWKSGMARASSSRTLQNWNKKALIIRFKSAQDKYTKTSPTTNCLFPSSKPTVAWVSNKLQPRTTLKYSTSNMWTDCRAAKSWRTSSAPSRRVPGSRWRGRWWRGAPATLMTIRRKWHCIHTLQQSDHKVVARPSRPPLPKRETRHKSKMMATMSRRRN